MVVKVPKNTKLTCQVPKLSLPSEIGSVSEEPIKQAFTWAGWRRWERKEKHQLSAFIKERYRHVLPLN